MLPSNPTNRSRRWIGILVCVLLGVSVGVWDNRLERQGRSSLLSSPIRTITSPIASLLVAGRQWGNRQIGWLFRGRSADREIERLRERVAALEAENARLREAAVEVARLRRQIGFSQAAPPKKLPATIIALRPDRHFHTLVIGRGTRDGVKDRAVVVAPQGLVGYVYDAAPTTAAVLLLTDGNAAVGARVQREESRATGIAVGDRTDKLTLRYVDRSADVRPGDVIVTSGLGGEKGIFPKGIPIGVVTEIVGGAGGALRTIRVQPSVDFDRLEEVFVLQ